jgi:hypothetical protein
MRRTSRRSHTGFGLYRPASRPPEGFVQDRWATGPAGAELHVQVHLDVEDGREAGRRFAHVSELGRLVDGERVGARNSVRNR